MSGMVLQLEESNHKGDDELQERVFVLLDGSGSIVAAVGPSISCESALSQSRIDAEDYSMGPVTPVSPKTIEMTLRDWGPYSREGVLHQARRISDEKGIPLTTEATERRFRNARDRELAAALWLVWLDKDKEGTVSLVRLYEAVCQIETFVLYWDADGLVTFDQFPSSEAAAQHVSEFTDKAFEQGQKG